MEFTGFKLSNKIIVMVIYMFAFKNVPMAKCAVPGTFFWKPRLGLDLAIPTTDFSIKVALPTKENIQEGLVVLVDGYQAGMSVVSVAAGATSAGVNPYFSATGSQFHTNAYRWALRYFSLIPYWMGGNGGNFCDTHKVWKRRFYYMEEMVPSWLRSALFYVNKQTWKQEDMDFKRFKKYAEPAFGKHFRFPSRSFRDFASFFTVETEDRPFVDSSSEDI